MGLSRTRPNSARRAGTWREVTGLSRVLPHQCYCHDMVTACPPSAMAWCRPSRWPPRVLWVAALLLGLVYAHGVSAEGVAGHLAFGAVEQSATVSQGDTGTASAAVEKASGGGVEAPGDHRNGDHDSSHPAHECLVGQPQYGSVGAAPCPAIFSRASAPPAGPSGTTGLVRLASGGCPLTDSAACVVLRI